MNHNQERIGQRPKYQTREVEERLDRLEKENRLLRLVGGGLVIGCICAVALGAQRAAVQDSVEAKEFILRNAEGKAALSIHSNPFDGQASVSILDRDGKPRATLDAYSLSFDNYIDGACQQTYLGTDEDGNSRLSFHDAKARAACVIGIAENRTPSLRFLDRNGKLRVQMMLNPEHSDAPDVRLLDSNEAVRIGFGMEDFDRPLLAVRRPDGSKALNLGTDVGLAPYLEMFNHKGFRSVELREASDAAPALLLLGKDGKPVFHAP